MTTFFDFDDKMLVASDGGRATYQRQGTGVVTTRPQRIGCATRLLLLLALPAAGQAQFNYKTNNDTITITGYYATGGEVIIPDMINGLPVASIGDSAFYNKSSLTSVTISTNVTSIGHYAFRDCTNLTSATIPDSVTSIGNQAFAVCTSLTNATIGTNVTSIGESAFASCTSLSAITVAAPNSFYDSVTGILFNKSQTMLIQYPAGKAGGDYAIPSSVTSIEEWAFFGCTSLTNVTIGTNVTSIGESAFSYCTRLSAITVAAPNSFYSSVAGVLFNESQSTLIQYPAGKVGTAYVIPTSVTSIGNQAFAVCTNLISVMIGITVTSIGNEAFALCTSLTNVTIPDSVTSIGNYAFRDCTRLTSVTVPNSITNVGSYAFWACTSMTNVTIGTNATSIGESAFSYCTRLSAITVDELNSFYSSVDGVLFNKSRSTLVQYPAGKVGSDYTIPTSVTSIGSQAFAVCTNLTSVTIVTNVTGIGDEAFAICTSLTNVTIPYSVTSIGSGAFQDCWGLISVTIGTNVPSLENYAFRSCTRLTGVYFLGDAPNLGWGVFEGANNASVYYLPGTTGWGLTFGEHPTVLWKPQVQASNASFGMPTNEFGLDITWASGMVVVVEACTNLANPIWSPLQTNILSGYSSHFSDPQWKNYRGRFYRLRWQ